MNPMDLVVVVALGSALYAVIVALAGRRQFLNKAVNPHRTSWLIAAASILWVGISLMRWEVQSWKLEEWGKALGQLVTDAPTPARIKVASLAVLLSLVFFSLVLWSALFLPRDPASFHRPEHRKKAFRYYVSKLRGGIDYALLAWGDGEPLEEELHKTQVSDRCTHLPKIMGADGVLRTRTPEDQARFWRELASHIHRRMNDLDALIDGANQGRNRRIVFDTEYGGIFFKYLRLPDPRNKVDGGLFLFGATLSQREMDSESASNQFNLLLGALQHIDRNIRLG